MQLLIQRVHNQLFHCHLNNNIIDRTSSSELKFHNDGFNYNVGMNSNCKMSRTEERQLGNWRYHLTNDHF